MSQTQDTTPDPSTHEGYVLPAENAAEMARLMLQDRLITQSMGGVLPELTDLSQTHHVLDIACGPGGWILDLAQQYPHIQAVGIDISQLMTDYASSMATADGIANARFQVMDATQPLQFPDNAFDLINGRILTGFLSAQQWPSLLRECARITRPGGILRLTEVEWGFTNSAAFDTLSGFSALGLYRAGHSFSPHGRTIGTSNVLRLLMRRAGYENIQYKALAIDFSADTEIHAQYIQDVLVVYKLLQPFFAQMQLATPEELDRLYKQTEADLQAEDFCGIDYYLTVWGSKSD